MGCDYYEVDGFSLHFSEDQDDWGCLCTFPYNWQRHQQLVPDDVRSLAILGAAVTIVHQMAMAVLSNEDVGDPEHLFIPDGVPQWMQNEIRRIVPDAPCVKQEPTSTDLAYSTDSERD